MRRLERVYVVLVAGHSYAIGLALLFLTAWGARLGGFSEVSPLFFARQAGAFHVVVASAYLIEYHRYGGVAILLTTKAIAVVFLGALSVLGGVPWVVPVSGLVDGVLGFVAWRLHRRACEAEMALESAP